MANEFKIKNGLYVSGSTTITNDATVTGSLVVSGGITGSLLGTSSYAEQALSSSFALTSSYSLSGTGFPFSGSAVITGSLLVTNLSGSGVRYVITDGQGNITAQTASAAIKVTQTYTASAGQTTFSVANGYSTGYVDVFINGTKLNGSEFTDTSGTNIVLVSGSYLNDVVEVVKYLPASGVSNNVLRTLTTFTAAASQSTFNVDYTPGLLDIFYNGSRLSPIEYTANNGTSFTLATASNAGDILDVMVYSYQVGAYAGIGGSGQQSQVAYYTTTSSISGSNNFTFDGSTLRVTGSIISSGSSTFVNIGPTILSGSLTVSGSITATGGVTISGSIDSASYASNAERLDNLDSTSFVFTSSYNATSASFSTRVTNNESTASVLTTASASFAVVSQSYSAASGSLSTRVTTLEAASASLNTASGSFSTRVTTLEAASSSLNTASGSFSTRVTTIESKYATTGSNTFTGPQYVSHASNAIGFTSTASLYTDGGLRVTKDAFVSGTLYLNNLTVYGTSSIQYITSSQLNVATNVITVNTNTPAVRFGGITVYDSGSLAGTGSLFWDSQNDRWVYSNPSGSTYDGGMLISGPRNTTGLGNEVGTTACALMMGQGGDHITSSGIFSYGNATCFYGQSYISSSGLACFSGTVCAPVHAGGTFTGTTVYGSTAVCAPTICAGTTCGTVGCFGAVCSPSYTGGTFSGTTVSGTTLYASTVACSPVGCFTTSCASSFVGGTVSGTTLYGSTAVCAPTIFGSTVVSGSVGCFTTICSPTHIGGTFSGTTVSGTTIYGSTAVCSPTVCAGTVCGTVGCFVSTCSPTYTGGTFSGTTVSGTTLYGSTAVCGPTLFGTTVVCGATICSSGNTCFGGMSIINNCLGIGTATPGQILDISCNRNAGTVINVRNACAGSSSATSLFLGNDVSTNAGGITVFAAANTGVAPYNPSGTYIYNNRAGGVVVMSECSVGCLFLGTSNTYRMTILPGGNVGIGVTPEQLLDVYSAGADPTTIAQIRANRTGYGSVRFQLATYAGGSTSTDRFSIQNDSGTKYFNILWNGNVGIGTSSINAKLEVAGAVMVSGADAVAIASRGALDFSSGNTRLLSFGANPSTQGGFQFLTLASNGTGITAMTISGANILLTQDATIYNTTGNLFMRAGTSGDLILGSGGSNDRMRITSGGNVGICNANPLARLHIGPEASVGGNTPAIVMSTAVGTKPAMLITEYTARSGAFGYDASSFLTLATEASVTSGIRFKVGSSFTSGLLDTGTTAVTITGAGTTCILQGARFGNGSTTLNYYEEGSWTPVLAGSSVAGTFGYANRSASYVRIGNYVYVRWGFQLNSASGASGTMRITGLPFTGVSWGSYQEPNVSVSTGNLACAQYAGIARVFVESGGTALQGRVANNGDTSWDISQFSGDEWVIGEIYYNV